MLQRKLLIAHQHAVLRIERNRVPRVVVVSERVHREDRKVDIAVIHSPKGRIPCARNEGDPVRTVKDRIPDRHTNISLETLPVPVQSGNTVIHADPRTIPR